LGVIADALDVHARAAAASLRPHHLPTGGQACK
jgi:hypothetical protein